MFDILQPAYAGLYSGAIHPTAEAHAIVADYVVRHARTLSISRGRRRGRGAVAAHLLRADCIMPRESGA